MSGGPADLVLLSGRLWDGTDRGEEALAVREGLIIRTGANEQMAELVSGDTTVVDIGGRRVVPGLIDSHIHLVRAGLRWNEDVRWVGAGSLDDALARLSAAAETKEPGRWIAVMGGWHPHQFAESRPPSRSELDDACPSHPVFVQRNYIEAFLNTRAMEEMGYLDDGAPGWVERSASSGSQTGRVVGAAGLQALRARLPGQDFEDQVAGTSQMLRELNRLGLTGAIDTGGFGMTPESYLPYFELWRRGEKGFRARLLVGPSQPGKEPEQLADWMRFVAPGFGDNHLRYLGSGEVLLFGAHDMEGLAPKDISGQIEPLSSLSERLAARGWTIHLHAILDTSVGAVLDAWEPLGAAISDLRFTITHADQISSANLERLAYLGLGMTVQNGMAYRGGDSIATWGEGRVRAAVPLREALELGIPLGAGTDATVVSSYNPWRCIWWMVTGRSIDGSPARDDGQLLTRDEALRLYTSGSSWFSFEEATRGTLRPGSWADLAVLSEDPLTVPPDDLPGIESVLTVVAGRIAHQATAEGSET